MVREKVDERGQQKQTEGGSHRDEIAVQRRGQSAEGSRRYQSA